MSQRHIVRVLSKNRNWVISKHLDRVNKHLQTGLSIWDLLHRMQNNLWHHSNYKRIIIKQTTCKYLVATNTPVSLQPQILQMPWLAIWSDLGPKCSPNMVNWHAVWMRCDSTVTKLWLFGAIWGRKRFRLSKTTTKSKIQVKIKYSLSTTCSWIGRMLCDYNFTDYPRITYDASTTCMITTWLQFPWWFLTKWGIHNDELMQIQCQINAKTMPIRSWLLWEGNEL